MCVEVVDDGAGAGADAAQLVPGFGLRGMRERAESLGGRLAAGPRVGGGFAVRARLPWATATESAAEPPSAPNGAP
jgi:signal transduction histidine kinase